MTPNQWRMLEILGRHSGEGTIEVRIAWGYIDYGDSEADNAKSWRINGLIVASLVRSLAKKGYATDNRYINDLDEVGYAITQAGIACLERRKVRQAS